MNNFWQNLVGKELESPKNEKKQQINISKQSQEALTDALNDDAESIPDEIPADQGGDTTNPPDQQTDMGGMDDMRDMSGGTTDDSGSTDTDFGSSGDDFGSSSGDMGDENNSSEPEQIEKDKFSLLNGKIEIIKRFNVLIEHANSVKEMFENNISLNKVIIEDLEELISIMEDIKTKVGIRSQAESLVRYRMCYTRLTNILNSYIDQKSIVK